jgi:hypothetical protein
MFTFCALQGALSDSTASQSILELDGGVKVLISLGWDETFDVEKLRELEKCVPPSGCYPPSNFWESREVTNHQVQTCPDFVPDPVDACDGPSSRSVCALLQELPAVHAHTRVRDQASHRSRAQSDAGPLRFYPASCDDHPCRLPCRGVLLVLRTSCCRRRRQRRL